MFFLVLKLSYCQEIQVPIDSIGKIMNINSELQTKLSGFNTNGQFNEAKLYKLSNDLYALEIFYNRGDTILKDRKLLDASEVFNLRNRLTNDLKLIPKDNFLDQSGRTSLLINSVLISLSYYGWALPTTLQIEDNKSYIATYMLTSASGFLIPYFLSKNSFIPSGATLLGTFGATAGIFHGMLLSSIIAPKNSNSNFNYTTGIGMGVSLAEGIGGYILAKEAGISEGKSFVLATGSTFGFGVGLSIAEILDVVKNDSNGKNTSAFVLGGSALGYFAGNILANQHKYSLGDGLILANFGVVGTLIPIAITNALVDSKNENYIKPIFTSALFGSILGLGFGHYILSNKEFNTNQGTFTSLGTLTGGLLGAGLSYLITTEKNDDLSKIILLGTAVGSSTGMYLMYNLFSDDALKAGKDLSSNNFKFEFHPESLTQILSIDNKEFKFENKPISVPIIKFSYSY